MIRPVLEELGNLYELTAKERYTDEMGLDLEIETGIASFLGDPEGSIFTE